MPRQKKSHGPTPSGHACAAPGCPEAGDYRAPLDRRHLHEYQWFCAAHIAEFNKKWNYFEGMSTDDIYAFQRDATTGHRPTWRMDHLGGNAGARLEEAFGRLFGDGPVTRAAAAPINARTRDALAQLDLEHPAEKTRIKSQYRELAKKYHPDRNLGNKNAEEAFKKITHAYQYLLEHYVES